MIIRLDEAIEAWLSLVERCVRDAEVACSNHVASIIFILYKRDELYEQCIIHPFYVFFIFHL